MSGILCLGELLLRLGTSDGALFAQARQLDLHVGGAEPASIALHAKCGFREVGRLHAAGWKHGRWLDNVYMQKALGPGSSEPPEL